MPKTEQEKHFEANSELYFKHYKGASRAALIKLVHSDVWNLKERELHAAIDAKEKAEADCQVWCERHNGLEVALSDESAKVAKLQAIVDRLPKFQDGSVFVMGDDIYDDEGNIISTHGYRVRLFDEPETEGEEILVGAHGCAIDLAHYFPSREAALSAAASSGAKEKQ